MRKLKLITIIVTAMAFLNLTAAHAEEGAPLFPLPFTPDFTRGGGWGVALGLGVEYENAYAGSDEYEFELDSNSYPDIYFYSCSGPIKIKVSLQGYDEERNGHIFFLRTENQEKAKKTFSALDEFFKSLSDYSYREYGNETIGIEWNTYELEIPVES